jgi:hypothetical protein
MRLGDDGDRMVVAGQHLQHLTGDAVFAFQWLIGIGICAQRQCARLVAGRGEFSLQQFGGTRLHQKAGFKVEAGREAEISVGWPRETIDATMFAAAIGVDRAVEGKVGRGVARDDGACGVVKHGGAQLGRLVTFPSGQGIALPAIGFGMMAEPLVTPVRIGQCATALAGSGDRGQRRDAAKGITSVHADNVSTIKEQIKNILS